MIGLDSNVLVRLVTGDDPAQTAAALSLVSRDPNEPLVISALLLAEVAWVLRSAYRFGRREIGTALTYLIRIDRLLVLERHAVVRAVLRFRDEDSRADFSDYLIQALNAVAGADTTVTFDQRAATDDGFVPIPIPA
ncbi:MAG: type II toxin-antitoxin system VapC family toxin [Beijerinckiaceae bacterium]